MDMCTGMLEGLPVSINTFLGPNSEMKNKKVMFNCGNLHFRDSAI